MTAEYICHWKSGKSVATWSGARPCEAKGEGKVSLPELPSTRLFPCLMHICLSYMVYLLSFQKLHPKKNQPWRMALQLGLAPAANQAEANKLAAKLRKTTLV